MSNSPRTESFLAIFVTTDEPVDVHVTVISDFTDPPYKVTKTTGYGRHAMFSFPETGPNVEFSVRNRCARGTLLEQLP